MGQLKWGGKTFYPQAPKPIKSDINELMKPLSEKVDKGNVWGSIIMNVPEETSVGPVSPTPTPSVTPTITPTASLTPTPTITPTSTLTPTPTPSSIPPISLSYVTQTGITTDSTSYTFSDVSIGGAGLIVLAIGTYVDGAIPPKTITGVTIGGVSATFEAAGYQYGQQYLAWARVSSGTTANVIISFGSGNGTPASCNIGVWRIQNNISDTPYQTKTYDDTSNTQTFPFTSLSANTVGVMGITWDQIQNPGVTWTNATGRYGVQLESLGQRYGGGDFTTAIGGDITVTTTYSGTGVAKKGIGKVWR